MNKTFLALLLGFFLHHSNAQTEFITTWKTNNPGTSQDNQITIPTYPWEAYDYYVDWGDGSSDSGVTGDMTHTYTNPGTFTISISGEFPRIYFNDGLDKQKLISVDQWGDIQWSSMEKSFYGCTNMDVISTDIPDLSQATDLNFMFRDCGQLVGNPTFEEWNVSNVTKMRSMFEKAISFNQNIGSWNVHQVTNMAAMFQYASSFNQDIGNWDVSNVVNMAVTFDGADTFNQNISRWNVSNVSVFMGTFGHTSFFNQDISEWDVSSATDMRGMFLLSTSFNQDIGNWNVSNVTSMINMFSFAISFNQDIGNWNVGSVTSMISMFYNAQSFNQNIDNWDVSNVDNMNSMFDRANAFNQDISNWDVGNVSDMQFMFANAGLSRLNYDFLLKGWSDLPNLQNGVTLEGGNSQYCIGSDARQKLIDNHGWSITDSGENCTGLNTFITTWKTNNPGTSQDNQITVPTFPGETYDYTVEWGDGTSDTNVNGNITHTYLSSGTYTVSISGIFPRIYFDNTALGSIVGDEKKIIGVQQWGTNAWTSMGLAFAGCRELVINAQDIPNLSNLNSLGYMFQGAGSLASPFNIPRINEWDISGITALSYMFASTSFNQDISDWDVSNVSNMHNMFFNSRFNQDIRQWNVSSVITMHSMFASSHFNQDLSTWDVGNVTDMSYMFASSRFNFDISSWDVSRVKYMWGLFLKGQFDHDISNWNVSNVTNMNFMFDDSDFSDENYDKLLIGWSQLPSVQNGVELGANDAKYCLSEEARQDLISNSGWTIKDYGKNCTEPAAFVTTWKTDNPGFSADNQITIPTKSGEIYDYMVDWGDGTVNTNVTGNITHTYTTPGIYIVSISGKFPRIYFNAHPDIREELNTGSDDDKIISIDQWGTNRWLGMGFAFSGCENLDVKATDIPDFTRGILASGMFQGCTSLIGNDSMNKWDTSLMISASYMFRKASQFNQSLNNWDLSSMLWIDRMFEGAILFNQDLGSWDISHVSLISSMFDDSGLSTKNYDNILKGWSQLQLLQNGLQFGASNVNYCDAEFARQSIIDAYGWIITDGGKDPNCNVDNDNDGISDHLDSCLNTPIGDTVDGNGCLVLSSTNFSVEGIGETCVDQNNAKIIITAVEAYDYLTTINGTDYSFTNNLTVDNLAPGTYEICIAVISQSFEQCYVLEIAEASNISGKSSLENDKMLINIDQGTAPYRVLVNGKAVLQTYSTAFSVDVQHGDFIEVLTGKVCEGSFSEMIEGDIVWRAHPNPTTGYFEIDLSILEKEVTIDLFTMHSQLISSSNYPVIGGRVKMDIEHLPEGIYITKVHLKKPITLKIVKQ